MKNFAGFAHKGRIGAPIRWRINGAGFVSFCDNSRVLVGRGFRHDIKDRR